MRRRPDSGPGGAPPEWLRTFDPAVWAGHGGHEEWHDACLTWLDEHPGRRIAGRGHVEQWQYMAETRPRPGVRGSAGQADGAPRLVVDGVDKATGEVVYPEVADLVRRSGDGQS